MRENYRTPIRHPSASQVARDAEGPYVVPILRKTAAIAN
jgi:hypothetical protein